MAETFRGRRPIYISYDANERIPTPEQKSPHASSGAEVGTKRRAGCDGPEGAPPVPRALLDVLHSYTVTGGLTPPDPPCVDLAYRLGVHRDDPTPGSGLREQSTGSDPVLLMPGRDCATFSRSRRRSNVHRPSSVDDQPELRVHHQIACSRMHLCAFLHEGPPMGSFVRRLARMPCAKPRGRRLRRSR